MRSRTIPAALLALSAVPIVAGGIRMTELSVGAAITPDNARFFASPLPVSLHIAGATVYTVVGAFQFAPALRRSRAGWHRAAGRVLVPAGLIAALAGMWMTLFSSLPEADGTLLGVFRVIFGTAMAASLVLGLLAIRRRDIAAHRAWMMRAYAIGLGAGTQAFTLLPWFVLVGTPGQLPKALLSAAGWLINLAVAEWVIRRPYRRLVS
ncbi:DUF2306 domain-containing protein [Nonomuraea soli]|uniref:Putative membrane protein n=1 Tax=Nonomuraea soli TaxID=1032476 RepID=A0A7W0CJI1_9ACTN|nr:DUF2306 domain-containing protein [Nonomuraea soli]MBA2892306.1 putative membrane protein [Nonomuraea soli]